MNIGGSKNISIYLLCAILLSSCATLHVEKLKDFTPESKEFVFITKSRWDPKLRIALQKNGFIVKRFSSQRTVIDKGRDTEIANIYDESGARYGIELFWDKAPGSNTCINGNGGYLINATLQVSDLQSNEVLLVIDNSGVTHLPCGIWITNETIFEKLSNGLKENWK